MDLRVKEAHMRIKRAWVAELAELSSMTKTEDARLKSFFTLNEDAYIPKFSNFEVVHKRRTVFIGTSNPEGDNTYLRGQTGNTRYLPIEVFRINVEGFQAVREQLFAEALQSYRAHLRDWWQLSSAAESMAQEAREARRQRSVYEDELADWLERTNKTVTWWEQIAEDVLELGKDRWDRRIQMEVTKALKAIGWYKDKRQRLATTPGHREKFIVPWRPGPKTNTRVTSRKLARLVRHPARTTRVAGLSRDDSGVCAPAASLDSRRLSTSIARNGKRPGLPWPSGKAAITAGPRGRRKPSRPAPGSCMTVASP